MLVDAPPRRQPEVDDLVETPIWSATMRAGKMKRVRLKWKSAHSRLERTVDAIVWRQ